MEYNPKGATIPSSYDPNAPVYPSYPAQIAQPYPFNGYSQNNYSQHGYNGGAPVSRVCCVLNIYLIMSAPNSPWLPPMPLQAHLLSEWLTRGFRGSLLISAILSMTAGGFGLYVDRSLDHMCTSVCNRWSFCIEYHKLP